MLALLLVGLMRSAAADDSNAEFLSHLFRVACLANLGNPGATRAWASAQNLQPITDPAALQVFAGPGPSAPGTSNAASSPAAAWVVFGPGRDWFAVSLRGAVESCAVWARQADPAAVRAAFLRGVRDPEKPDLDVRDLGERTSATPFGPLSIALFRIVNRTGGGFIFTVITSERSGGAFQASLQVAPVPTR
jgi:hypothetical protein